MSNVLEVINISKSFKDYKSEWTRIFSWFGLDSKPKKEHKILHQINFTILPGEAIGIVGQNGAGKSTLLKIITGTLKPSNGSVKITGRISAILELGMGFHPDMTGRQNVYHSAGLMGYTKEQIDDIIDDIYAFAEIGDYFDQPVRTYSSGMKMRVAFSVATMYRPDILIVDEALSVGDAYFKHKSFDRIRKFQKQGTSLLLVSHDRGAIQSICSRALLLEKGTIIKDGNPEMIMDFYNALIAEKGNSTVTQVLRDNSTTQIISGTRDAISESISIINQSGEKIEYVSIGEKVTLKINVKIQKDIPELVVGYVIKDRLGQEVFGTNTYHHDKALYNLNKNQNIVFLFSFPMNIGIGSYSISSALHSKDTHLSRNYEWKDRALIFNVVNINKKKFVGISWLEPTVKVTCEK